MVKPGQVIVRSDSSGQLLRVVDPHAWDIGTSLLEQCFGELRRLVYFLVERQAQHNLSREDGPQCPLCANLYHV